jgi:ATP-dependent RNA helicase DDX35
MALHAGLTMTEQMQVFEPSPPDSRKVVVATNIAEVSLQPWTASNSNLSTLLGEHNH